MSVLIIAEAGVNHGGNLDLAIQLVDAAADAGADLVKFQTFRAVSLATQSAPKAEYQLRFTDRSESQFEMLRRLELTAEMHDAIIAHCGTRGIGFLSTGFDIQSLDYLNALGVSRFKIPSGEITNLPYLRHVGSLGKPLILSTGMATIGEVEAALDVLESTGSPRSRVTVLHCTTEYPTPMQNVNLLAMCGIRDTFGVSVGYSDHTLGIEVPVAAVALGAAIIEKHITLNRDLPGPDQRASLEPEEFTRMVRAIRNIEQALGDGIKRPTSSEAMNRRIARKSLVAACSIRAGEQFTLDNVTVKRPGTGISPMRLDEVLGRLASRDFLADELIVL
jgi:N,N'-diacetyllegionaminate synthase